MGGKSTWYNENAENNVFARIMARRGRESCAGRRVAATRAGSCRVETGEPELTGPRQVVSSQEASCLSFVVINAMVHFR